MNDAQSTIAGLKNQDCPGGGWTGMPAELERPIVADCLAHGSCGCVYGDAVQHIERQQRDHIGAHRMSIDTICHLEAEINRLTSRGHDLAESCEEYKAALVEMRNRDEVNGSLPPAYRAIIDAALDGGKP